MQIKELLINVLMNTELFEMAFSKRVAMDKARYLQNQIARHLAKIVMYSNSPHVPHWCDEVNAWLDDIQDNKLKGTNRPLQEKDLFNILLDEPLGTLDDVRSRMNRNYREYPTLVIDEPDPAIISKKLSWILLQVSSDIGKNLFVDIKQYIS